MSESANRPVGWTAVVAMTPTGVIGKDGDLPWRLSSDLRRFKKLTMGGVLLMGRRTYESIGRPLPGRRTIVLTRNSDWSADGVQVAGRVERAMELAGSDPTFVVGGAEIYRLLWPYCDQVYLTRVLAEIDGDTHLQVNWGDFEEVAKELIPVSPRDELPSEFVKMIRRNS